MTGRQGRRRRKLLDDLKERRGYSHLKEEALDRTMWRDGFGRGFGLLMNESYKRHNFRKIVIECEMCVLIFSTTFVRKISHSKKNPARYKCSIYSCTVPGILVRF